MAPEGQSGQRAGDARARLARADRGRHRTERQRLQWPAATRGRCSGRRQLQERCAHRQLRRPAPSGYRGDLPERQRTAQARRHSAGQCAPASRQGSRPPAALGQRQEGRGCTWFSIGRTRCHQPVGTSREPRPAALQGQRPGQCERICPTRLVEAGGRSAGRRLRHRRQRRSRRHGAESHRPRALRRTRPESPARHASACAGCQERAASGRCASRSVGPACDRWPVQPHRADLRMEALPRVAIAARRDARQRPAQGHHIAGQDLERRGGRHRFSRRQHRAPRHEGHGERHRPEPRREGRGRQGLDRRHRPCGDGHRLHGPQRERAEVCTAGSARHEAAKRRGQGHQPRQGHRQREVGDRAGPEPGAEGERDREDRVQRDVGELPGG